MMIGHWTHEQLLRYQICINFIKIIEISNFFLFEGNQNAVTLRTSAPMTIDSQNMWEIRRQMTQIFLWMMQYLYN
ncbi:hypothetical protein RIR_jg27160.t2 [Rhizophagus irregularis DAOM 181602=DAOM 197198]|nr:hypothetical protein RIR_jg27160.t2 [Rhizophagus irregularis DAOM 181602=DAOM 197198]